MGSFKAKYLANQIAQMKLKYKEVVEKHPGDKEDIDKYLEESGMQHLIEE